LQNSINGIFESIFNILINFMSGFVSDPGMKWGLAIILFTIAFNILVFPLNWKALKSSKKMSAIQPELKKIQERYKNDPQKLQFEQKRLMSENGVSMFGGCLPMLLQWPLFIALFNVFRQLASNGTLSNLKFTPLISDLSATGNIPLTVLTVATMYLTTWLTQKGQEKSMSPEALAQAKQMNTMNYMMMAMMGWFTWTQPAALGLYWVTGNIFRALQQWLMNKLDRDNKLKMPEIITEEQIQSQSYGQTKAKKNKVVRK